MVADEGGCGGGAAVSGQVHGRGGDHDAGLGGSPGPHDVSQQALPVFFLFRQADVGRVFCGSCFFFLALESIVERPVLFSS